MTDVSVEFRVPAGFVVQQSPQNVPPAYNGDKMVVYGILTPKGSVEDKEITGNAILKGQILGKKLEHSIPFTFHPAAASCPSLPTIHHLAAKALIKDWQDQGKSKEEIVKLSVESSIISSHTAFIAVDEESSEPVSGAIRMWDIQAQISEGGVNLQRVQQQVASVRMVMALNVHSALSKEDRLENLSAQADFLSASSATFSKSSKRKKGGFSFGSLFSGFTDRLYGSKSESFQPPVKGARRSFLIRDECSADSESDSDEELDIDDLEEGLSCMAEAESKSNLEMNRILKASTAPKLQSAHPSAFAQMPVNTLTSIITAQQADGSWKLDSTVMQLLEKPQSEIERACSVECKDAIAAIWATVLILTLLKKKYSNQQDEWELIAMKAESWVKKQALPCGLNVKDLYIAAEAFI